MSIVSIGSLKFILLAKHFIVSNDQQDELKAQNILYLSILVPN